MFRVGFSDSYSQLLQKLQSQVFLLLHDDGCMPRFVCLLPHFRDKQRSLEEMDVLFGGANHMEAAAEMMCVKYARHAPLDSNHELVEIAAKAQGTVTTA